MDLELLTENVESREFLEGPLSPLHTSSSSALQKELNINPKTVGSSTQALESESSPSRTLLVETLFPPSFLQDETGSVIEGAKNPQALLNSKFPPACLPQLRAFLLLADVLEEKALTGLLHCSATVRALGREIRVLEREEDPLIAFAPEFQAWLWLLEDALTLSAKEERKGQSENRLPLGFLSRNDAVLSDSLQGVGKGVKEVGKRIEEVEKALNRAKKSWRTLVSSSAAKFGKVVSEAEDHFDKVVKPLLEGKVRSYLEVKKEDRSVSTQTGGKAELHLRWNVNGLMFQLENDERWVKFLSLSPKGRRILLEALVQGAREFLSLAIQELSQLRLELEGEIRPKLKGLQTLLKKDVTAGFFFPREAKEVHCLVLSCCDLVAQMEPQLERIKGAFLPLASAVSDLKDREWRIRKGKGRRVPLDRWGEIDLQVGKVGRGQELREIVRDLPNRSQNECPPSP